MPSLPTTTESSHTHESSLDNPIRGRLNAAFFQLADGYMHWKYAAVKGALFEDLPDRVVELGSGTGANLRYLRPGTRLVAVEPNVHMHAGLRRGAQRHGVELDLVDLEAERLPLADHSVDAVICSLVLCTVDDPEQVLREVRRVLVPGGRFLCIEHVAAHENTVLGWIQRAVFRPWRWAFEGCHTHRDTVTTLREAGFQRVEVQTFTMSSIFIPVRPQIAAVCNA